VFDKYIKYFFCVETYKIGGGQLARWWWRAQWLMWAW